MNTDRLTREQVLAMKPGPELDALVARKLFGVLNPDSRWRLSEDISAAWEVAEQLQKQGYAVCIELLPYEETSVGVYEADPANQIAYAKAQTPAEAICKAALLALEGGEGE